MQKTMSPASLQGVFLGGFSGDGGNEALDSDFPQEADWNHDFRGFLMLAAVPKRLQILDVSWLK
jgi:hypothetical protein